MNNKKAMAVLLGLLIAGTLNGCAIHHYDDETGIEHLWGIGHMQMRVTSPAEGLQAVVRGVDTIGLAAGTGAGNGYLLAGWQSVQRVDVVNDNTSVRLEFPSNTLLSIRVGSSFPLMEPKPPTNKSRTPLGDPTESTATTTVTTPGPH
jgi:hypothetical protein